MSRQNANMALNAESIISAAMLGGTVAISSSIIRGDQILSQQNVQLAAAIGAASLVVDMFAPRLSQGFGIGAGIRILN
jgi:hypothetical protein